MSTPPDPLAAALLLSIGSTEVVQLAGAGQGKTICQIGPNRLVQQFLGKPLRWLEDGGVQGVTRARKSLLWISVLDNHTEKLQVASSPT